MRVSAEQEEAGLDIVEHGMYGYPEQFIPVPERPVPALGGAPVAAPVMQARPAPSEA
jgi:ammonium transporter, Amt family